VNKLRLTSIEIRQNLPKQVKSWKIPPGFVPMLFDNTPDSFLNISMKLSGRVVRGVSHFIKVSSVPDLKKILLTAG